MFETCHRRTKNHSQTKVRESFEEAEGRSQHNDAGLYSTDSKAPQRQVEPRLKDGGSHDIVG